MNKDDKSKIVFKVFFVWQEEAENVWLNQQSAKGWHMQKVWPYVYRFEKGEPRDWVYRFDFRSETDAELEDYFQLCRDAGWQHVCSYGNWRYFRADANTALTTGFFTDTASQIAKYWRIAALLALVTFPALYTVMMLSSNTVRWEKFSSPTVLFTMRLTLGVLASLAVFALLAIVLKIHRLKRQGHAQ